ncbi:MAG: ABC transporter permease, partial [Planctomycetales bacterium]|nr:ABC transporter permease [Planctomycetales bacterium]
GRGVTLFVTTHYMDEAERCTDVGYIYLSRLLVLGKPNQLKQLPEVSPQGTRRCELQVPEPSVALQEFRRAPGVLDATLFGQSIHLLLDQGVDQRRLLAQVASAPADAELRDIPPSLEDVFVTLTSNAERAASGGLESLTIEPESAKPEGEDSAGELAIEEKSPAEERPEDDHDARTGGPLRGFGAILEKEFAHLRRQPSTLFFALVVPLIQTVIFGFALDTQIENIPLVVFDQDGRRYGRELIEAMVNTRRFVEIERALDEESFRRAITAGRAKAGLRIPPDYGDRIVRGEQATVQLLIDGSDSQVATTALNTAQLLGLNLSIGMAKAKAEAKQFLPARDPYGRGAVPIEIRPRLLYNPDLESSHFFVPGLVGIILQLVTLFLTSFAVVRERELGTLEQLFVTPVSRGGLLFGKLAPYALIGFLETLVVLSVMVFLFGVPIHGNVFLLLSLTMLFMVCSLGLGLLVSTIAKTQLEAVQMAFIIMLPSVLLSGFMFPRSEMPTPIYLVTFGIPVTYFVEILRGVVLRGADFFDLIGSTIGLSICTTVVLTLSLLRFRKQLA